MVRPKKGEFNPYFKNYIAMVPNGDIMDLLYKNTRDAVQFFESIPVEKHNYRYEEDKWNIKEMLIHLIDAERVFSYRALVAARGDKKTALQPMDDHLYVKSAAVDGRRFHDLVEEFKAVRHATEKLFETLTEKQMAFKANGVSSPITARALGYIIVGHMMHHMKVIKEWYL
jgi:hypothetical protein